MDAYAVRASSNQLSFLNFGLKSKDIKNIAYEINLISYKLELHHMVTTFNFTHPMRLSVIRGGGGEIPRKSVPRQGKFPRRSLLHIICRSTTSLTLE